VNSKDPVYEAAWARFYRSKPLPTEGSGWLRTTQLVMMTAAGRLLEGTVKGKDGMAPALREVLTATRKSRKRSVDRKVEGEVRRSSRPRPRMVLTIYDRPLAARAGRLRLPEGTDLGGRRTEASGASAVALADRRGMRVADPAGSKKGQTVPFP
jgi:hypothetical protein